MNFKFRLWDHNLVEMYKPNELIVQFKGDEVLVAHVNSLHQFLKFELMQSSGLEDEDGIEVFVGDVLEVAVQPDLDEFVRGEVVKENGVIGLKNVLNGWGYESGLIPLIEIGHRYKVIGNVYENKELLNNHK